MARPIHRLAAAVTVLAAVTTGLTACGSDSGSSASGDSLKVGVIYLDTQGFYGGVRKGIEDGADKAGTTVDIVETNAQDDASKERSEERRVGTECLL